MLIQSNYDPTTLTYPLYICCAKYYSLKRRGRYTRRRAIALLLLEFVLSPDPVLFSAYNYQTKINLILYLRTRSLCNRRNDTESPYFLIMTFGEE